MNQTPLDGIYGTIYQPHETTTVEVIAKLPEGSLATIGTIDNSVEPGQKNTITVPVISEAGAIKNYKVVVICKETNNKIDNIEIKGIEYVAGTDEYDFSTTPNKTVYVTYATSRISFSITLNGQYSQIWYKYNDGDEIQYTNNSKLDLTVGDNTFIIYAVSEVQQKDDENTHGTEYTIIVNRTAPDSDATLSSLEFLINGVNKINEEFESSNYTYTVDIPENETATKGTIVATTTSSVAKIVSGTGEITLPSISQAYYIVVEAQSGSKLTYEIRVIKEGSQLDSNNKITDIDVLDGSTNYMVDTQKFQADNPEYNITLPWNVSSVSIDVTPEKDTATIIGAGIKSLEQGETKTYEVYAKAQNSSIGTKYYITISRMEADHDAYLTSLTVGNTTIDLIDGTYTYDIRVERSVTDIEIKAIPCENATVSGDGNKNLSEGKNGYEVEVTAQDGVTKQIYYVNIFRNEDKNTIKNITVSNSNYVFDEKVITPEKIVIPYSKKVVTITVETDALYPKTINGAGTTDFDPGIHTIEIYVVSDFGTKGTKYTLTIEILDPSNDNYLKEFEVQIKGENVIEYDYNDLVLREKTLFTIEDVADDVLDVYIKAVKNNDNATVTGVGNRTLSNFDPDKHSCTLTVTVTAENGDVREIHLVFVRDSLKLEDNNDITDIVIKGSDGVTYFDSYKKEDVQYQVEVPYEVVSITIEATTPLGVNSTLKGNTLYTFGNKYLLDAGVYATSQSGIKGTEYKFTITRQEPNSDASLEWIKINGSIITGFDSQKTEYSFLVNNAVDEIHLLSKALVSSSTVEVQMGGNVVTESILPLEAGKNNQITIISTAQDGSKKAYTLNVTRASADGVLSDLYLEGVNFHDKDDRSIVVNYNPEVNEYYATVSYAVSSVNVCASTSDSTVTVRGTGLINLSVGSQELQVSAIPTIGNIGVYTITIIRKAEANSITDVKDFNIAEIEGFKDVFTNDVDIYDESYNLTVGPEVTKLTLDLVFDTAQYEDEPTVEVTQNELKFGNNIVYVKVTATDKTTTRLIALHVKRLSVTVLSAAIEEIEAFAEEFSNDINEYSYAVDNSVKSLTFDIKLKEECGSYAISNTDLTEGKVNVITITISVGDEVCKVITLNVLRTTANNTSTLPIGLIIAVAIASTAILVTSYFMCKKRKQRRG